MISQIAPDTKGKEVLVPLTSCMYVPGTISDAEKLLIDVGTGYYVERVRCDGRGIVLGHFWVSFSFSFLFNEKTLRNAPG